MLEDLFGSQTAAKCLVYLAAQREGYPLEIAKAFGISNTQVLRTLNRLEQADILVGKNSGRTRLYSLNSSWYLSQELSRLLAKALTQIPLDQQEMYFMRRKRPRKKNKKI